MEKTLLDEFEEYGTIKNKKFTIDEINSLSTTKILLLICENKQKIEKIEGLKNINEYNQTDEFENEMMEILNIPKSNKTTLSFIFNELIGNVYDHSQFHNGYIMGKEFENFHELSFIDDGITIPQSLKNANYTFNDDCEYLIEALNGLSTKKEIGFIERGTGLNNTSNIVTNGGNGSILLVSGCALAYLTSNELFVKEIPNCLKGTLISLRIKLKSKIDIYNYLNQITYKY